jgi:hypothetical protein
LSSPSFAPTPAWPHGPLREFFPDLFFVVGTNKVHHADVDLQTSRTMLVVREAGALTLINTVRLEPHGLEALDALGTVRNVIRLGAFHGRDDPFYRDRYHAQLWALPSTIHADGREPDQLLNETAALPLTGARLLEFHSAKHPEAALLLPREGGILVTCDAIQNWSSADPFFSAETAEIFAALGLMREANIPSTWIAACEPDRKDFDRLLSQDFRHLVSAHGEPLLDRAHASIDASLKRMGPSWTTH